MKLLCMVFCAALVLESDALRSAQQYIKVQDSADVYDIGVETEESHPSSDQSGDISPQSTASVPRLRVGPRARVAGLRQFAPRPRGQRVGPRHRVAERNGRTNLSTHIARISKPFFIFKF